MPPRNAVNVVPLHPGASAQQQRPPQQRQSDAYSPPPGPQVKLLVRNFSDRDLDVFVENPDGEQIFVRSIGPRQQLVQTSPAGYFWCIAQDDDWKGTFRKSAQPVQVIRYPEAP